MANRGARQGRAQDRGNVFRANLLSSEQSPLVLGVPAKQLCGRGSAAKVSAGSRCGLRPHAAGSIYAKGTTAWMGLPRKVRQVEGIAFEGVKELPEPGSLLDLDGFLILRTCAAARPLASDWKFAPSENGMELTCQAGSRSKGRAKR